MLVSEKWRWEINNLGSPIWKLHGFFGKAYSSIQPLLRKEMDILDPLRGASEISSWSAITITELDTTDTWDAIINPPQSIFLQTKFYSVYYFKQQ